jgi:hypothetical protein
MVLFRLRALESSSRSSIIKSNLGGVSNAGFVSLGEETPLLTLSQVSEALKRN